MPEGAFLTRPCSPESGLSGQIPALRKVLALRGFRESVHVEDPGLSQVYAQGHPTLSDERSRDQDDLPHTIRVVRHLPRERLFRGMALFADVHQALWSFCESPSHVPNREANLLAR